MGAVVASAPDASDKGAKVAERRTSVAFRAAKAQRRGDANTQPPLATRPGQNTARMTGAIPSTKG
jgi:hypothetical protein